jgi:hypothetical protein
MQIDDINKAPRKAVIEVLGISEGWFHKLRRAGVLEPVDGKTTFSLPACVRSYLKFHQDGEGTDMASEKLKLVVAQRKQIEQRTRAEERELVPVQEAQAAFSAVIAMVAAQLDGLPGRMAGELAGLDDPAAIRETLFVETRRIRDAAAHRLESFNTDQAGGGPDETATAEDGGRVGRRE